MKYKVRDKVRVRSDLTCEKDGVAPAMAALKGKVVTISDIDEDGDYHIGELKEYYWTDELFEGLVDNSSEYSQHITDMLMYCERVLTTKHKEYATDDHFHNFNVAAKLQGITPQQALIGMMDKHVVSVHDLVNEHAEGREISLDMWQEKIGDNINYLLILWAMVNMHDL